MTYYTRSYQLIQTSDFFVAPFWGPHPGVQNIIWVTRFRHLDSETKSPKLLPRPSLAEKFNRCSMVLQFMFRENKGWIVKPHFNVALKLCEKIAQSQRKTHTAVDHSQPSTKIIQDHWYLQNIHTDPYSRESSSRCSMISMEKLAAYGTKKRLSFAIFTWHQLGDPDAEVTTDINYDAIPYGL